MKRLTVLLIFILCSNGLAAQHTPFGIVPEAKKEQLVVWDFQLIGGIIDGTAYEYVYYDDSVQNTVNDHLSELIWDFSSPFSFGVRTQAVFFNRFSLGFTYWRSLNSKSGEMDDYDWKYTNISNYTNWSNSTITSRDSYVFNSSLSFRILRNPNFSPTAGIGLNVIQWDWKDSGHEYIYTSSGSFPIYEEGDDLLNYGGDFNGANTINYRVTHTVPYLQAGFLFLYPNMLFEAGILYSPFVESRGRDDHVLRELLFYDTASFGNLLELYISWQLSFFQNLNLGLNCGYQFLSENRGTTTTYSNTGFGNSDDGGFAYKGFYWMLSIGFTL